MHPGTLSLPSSKVLLAEVEGKLVAMVIVSDPTVVAASLPAGWRVVRMWAREGGEQATFVLSPRGVRFASLGEVREALDLALATHQPDGPAPMARVALPHDMDKVMSKVKALRSPFRNLYRKILKSNHKRTKRLKRLKGLKNMCKRSRKEVSHGQK